jgi:hypothetical protein
MSSKNKKGIRKYKGNKLIIYARENASMTETLQVFLFTEQIEYLKSIFKKQGICLNFTKNKK